MVHTSSWQLHPRGIVVAGVALLAMLLAVVAALGSGPTRVAHADTESGYASGLLNVSAWVETAEAFGPPNGGSGAVPNGDNVAYLQNSTINSQGFNGFGLEVPPGSDVTGITVTPYVATSDSWCRFNVALIWSGNAGDATASVQIFPTAALAAYPVDGSSIGGGVWGRSWTASEIALLSVRLQPTGGVTCDASASGEEPPETDRWEVDAVHVEVTYTPPVTHSLRVCKILQRADDSLYTTTSSSTAEFPSLSGLSVGVEGPNDYSGTFTIPSSLPYGGTVSVEPFNGVYQSCDLEEVPEGTYTYEDEAGTSSNWEAARFHEGTEETVIPLADFCTHGSAAQCDGTIEVTEDMRIWVLNQVAEEPEPETYTLNVSRNGAGTGTVTSSPGGINCGVVCDEEYEDGTVVTLTATPAGDSTFVGWTGTGCTTGTVTMSTDRTCTATFDEGEPEIYTLTVTLIGDGSGTVTSSPGDIDCPGDCSDEFEEGTLVTLTPVADPGSVFVGWSTGCGTTLIQDDFHCNALFELLPPQDFTLEVFQAGPGTGTITSSPGGINCPGDCDQDYDSGTAVTLTATADDGFVFGGWVGTGCVTGTVVMSTDRTCTAMFDVPAGDPQHVLSVILAGDGEGSVTSSPPGILCGEDCSELYDEDAVITLTATADEGSTFEGWSGAGCDGGVVTMSAAATCTATFDFDGDGTYTYELGFRWTLLTWVGEDGVSVGEALADIADHVTAVYVWDGDEWLGYFPGFEGIPGLNQLETLTHGGAFWIAIDEPEGIEWEVPDHTVDE